MKTILVTAIGSYAGGTVIQTCKREGYRVLGCDIYPAPWVVNSLDVEQFFQAPYATEREEYIAFIKTICREQNVDLIIPLTDVEVDVFTTLKDTELSATVCISKQETIAWCRDKYQIEQYLKPLGICQTIPGQLLSETEIETLVYPVVLKPCNGRSSQGLRMVEGRVQMEQVMEECQQAADNYLVQPKIGGSVITVDVVRNANSGQVVCLPRRELLRTFNGSGTSVYVFPDEGLERQCKLIAEALGVNGCVNMEFIEESPERRYFLECNPRFAGGVAFSVKAGYDMVKNHLYCFEGKQIEPMPQIKPQYIARRYEEYVMKS